MGTIIRAETTFDILPAEAYEEHVDLILLPANDGVEQMRELHYPGDALPPIIYEDMPDRWVNFDTAPLTSRPLTRAEMTLAGNKIGRWPGYIADQPVQEIWLGRERTARMTIDMLRRLAEYFLNPPSEGYITWHPKDRTTKVYNIVIENLDVGRSGGIQFDYLATYHDLVTHEITLTFRIVGEAEEGS